MKNRPILVSMLAWFIIVTSALGIISAVLPFFSNELEKTFSIFLHQGKWVSFLSSILRNAFAIFASVGLLKGYSWGRLALIIYFVLALFLNWVLYEFFNWITLAAFIVYAAILFLPTTNKYLKSQVGNGASGSTPIVGE